MDGCITEDEWVGGGMGGWVVVVDGSMQWEMLEDIRRNLQDGRDRGRIKCRETYRMK